MSFGKIKIILHRAVYIEFANYIVTTTLLSSVGRATDCRSFLWVLPMLKSVGRWFDSGRGDFFYKNPLNNTLRE